MPAKEEHFPDCRSGNQKCRNLQNLTECVLNTTMIMNEMFKFGKPEKPALFERSKKLVSLYGYVGRHKRAGNDSMWAWDQSDPLIIVQPKPKTSQNQESTKRVMSSNMIENKVEFVLWQGTAKEQISLRRTNLEECLVNAFNNILKQWYLNLHRKIKKLQLWDNLNQDKDLITLLKHFQILCGHESHQEPLCNMVQLIKISVNFWQERNIPSKGTVGYTHSAMHKHHQSPRIDWSWGLKGNCLCWMPGGRPP